MSKKLVSAREEFVRLYELYKGLGYADSTAIIKAKIGVMVSGMSMSKITELLSR